MSQITKVVQRAYSQAEKVVNNNPQLRVWAGKEDFHSIQEWLEQNLNTNSRLSRIIDSIESKDQGAGKEMCEELGLDYRIVVNIQAQIILHRRLDISALFGILEDKCSSIQEVTDFIDKMIDNHLVICSGRTFTLLPALYLSKEEEEWLDIFQSNPPMVCPPRKVKKVAETIRNGYLTLNKDIWTKKADAHQEVPTYFLDMQNALKYQLNYAVWDMYIKDNPYIPKRNKEDSDMSYSKKMDDAYRVHFKKAFLIHLYRLLGIQDIWILNKYDSRARNYPFAYLINPQGTDTDKGLLSFPPAPISHNGIMWLIRSIANCYNAKILGVSADKCDFEVRSMWFIKQLSHVMLMDKSTAMKEILTLSKNAESPTCFVTQMHNLWWITQALQRGDTPMCWSITHWDATASGYQIQSCMARDREMAVLCNLFGTEIKDTYTGVYKDLIKAGIPDHYTRKDIKECLIPAMYSSTMCVETTFPDPKDREIFEKVMSKYKVWELNKAFPSLWDPKAFSYSWTMPDGFKVYRVVKDLVEYHLQWHDIEFSIKQHVNKPVKKSRELGPNITHAVDGLFARELAGRLGLTLNQKLALELLRSQEELWTYELDDSRRLMLKLLHLAKVHNFYSIRILQEVTRNNIDLVPDAVWEKFANELPSTSCGISEIHDSFGVHPDHAEDLMQQYRYVMHDFAESNYLCVVLDCLKGNPEGFTQRVKDPEFSAQILKGRNALS